MERRRVVITGMGAISPIGNTVDEMWENARQGNSGIDWVQGIDVPPDVNPVARQVKNFKSY